MVKVEYGAPTGLRGRRLREGLTALVFVVASSCGQAEAGDTDTASFTRVINVEVAEVTTESFVENIRLTAVATAEQDVQLEAEESGAITELFVRRGDAVAVDAPIAKIDDRLLRSQVAQARAASELASQSWDRRRRLWEEDSVGPEIAYLEARYAAEQASATLDGLETRLARTVIRAPFAGLVEELEVDVGTMVGPGRSVARLVDAAPIIVRAGVPERYAADVHAGDPAMVRFQALDPAPQQGSISFVGATIDPRSRTFLVEVSVPNADGRIKPEMVADMVIVRDRREEAVVVPQDALVRVEDGYVAFVVERSNGSAVARALPVHIGPTQRNLVVIERGLEPGQELIVVGQKAVTDGDVIRVVAGGGEPR